MRTTVGLALLILVAVPAWSGDNYDRQSREWINYALRCQGCHLPDAMGMHGKVPRMNGFVGYFLHSEEGRQFIIQVPGVSKSSLSDAELSDLMNWVVREYSAEQMPDDFVPYTAAEIGRLRRNPEADPLHRRADILLAIAENVPALRCYSDAWVTLGGCE